MDALDLIKNSSAPAPAPAAYKAAAPASDAMTLLSKALAPAPQPAQGDGRVGDFVQQYRPVAERVGKQLGVAPETLLGQWGLETGWGKSVIPGTYNLGNIKDFSGKGTRATDNMTGSTDAYRTYESADAFADDFSSLLSRRYKSAMGSGGDASRFFTALKANGYAEDPDYVSKGARAAQMAAQAMGTGPAREAMPLIPLGASAATAKAKEDRGTGGAVKDGAIALTAGAIGSVGSLASLFGADNFIARNASEAADRLMKQQSPQRQAQRQKRQAIVDEAEATGSTWDQVVAHVGSFADAPVETILSGIGSSAPTLLAALIPGGQGAAAAWIIRGAQGAMGAAQGAGAVKNSIYEAAEKKLIENGADAETAAKVAAGAQAYDSANGKQIALGAILGAAAGTLGAEAALSKAVNKVPGAMGSRVGNAVVSGLAEAPTEALQGGQERLASNTALQNLGFDVPTWQGVAGQAALEGVAGAGVGAGFGAAQKSHVPATAPKAGDVLRDAAKREDSPMAKAAVAAGADQHIDAQAEAMQAEAVPEQEPTDPLAERVAGIRDMLRNRDVIGQMRDAQTGVSMNTLLGDLATAGSPNTKPALREQALERVETAMYWAGIDPKGIKVDEPATQTGTPLLAHDTVLDVDGAGNVTGVSQRQAQRDAQASREPFSDVTPVQPGPYTPTPAAPAAPQLTDSSRTITVDGQKNAATAGQRSELLARENQRVREPFTDITPVPSAPQTRAIDGPAAKTTAAAAPQLAPQNTNIEVGGNGSTTTLEQRQAQNNAPREGFKDVTPVAGATPTPSGPARAGREATAIRQRREDLMQHARNGLTSVERRGDRFVMVNPQSKQEYWLGSTADAALARKAVNDVIAEQANKANTNPTEGQKKQGNYRKGRIKFQGMNIAIENPVGSVRSGTDPNGQAWQTPMEWAHYGDLEGTKGADGDPVDVYLAADTRPNVPAYVIDQYNLDGSFDEHKVVMGAFSEGEALRIYDAGFTDGTGPQRRGAVTKMTPEELKTWAKSAAAKKPAGEPKAKPKSEIEQLAEAAGGRIIDQRMMDGHMYALLDRLPDSVSSPTDQHGHDRHDFAVQKLLEHLASAFGKKIGFYVTTAHADGFINPTAPNTIYVNASTQIDVNAVFGHELMHMLKRDVPQLHDALTQAVLAKAKDSQKVIDHYTALDYSADQAVEELVSDVGGDLMRKPEFWIDVFDHLYDQNSGGAARKVLKKFMDLINRLWKDITQKGKSYAQYGAGQALLDQPAEIREAFVKAIAIYARDTGLHQALGGPKPSGQSTTSASNLQNRDRSRAASVAQMQGIANAPDYGRLGISRTPDSGAPMVFATGDKTPANTLTGKRDTATMSDGQRVPFTYAAIEASDLQPSHMADGSTNPEFSSTEEGVVKALNNGRSAGIKTAYDNGKADTYRAEMMADADSHGIDAAKLAAMKQPVLVRLYAEKENTSGMAERSQAQSMGLSATEQAAQDAKLIDAGVLSVYEPGDVTSMGNLDLARAFVGKLQATGQDVSKMMLANGALSSDGASRLRAALVQAAYGDGDLVTQMFDRSDTDIQAIGNALRDVAGEWAVMREKSMSSAINPEADATEHLLAALRMVQKQRREGAALADQVGQVDLESGTSAHPLAIGMLRVLYDGEHFTKARSREAVTQMLRTYVAAAMQTRADGGLLGDVLGAQQIIESLTQGELADAIKSTTDSSAAGSNPVPATPAGAEQGNAADGQDAGPTRAGERGQPADAAQGQPADNGQSLLASYSPDELKAQQQAKDEAQAQAQAQEQQAAKAERKERDQADIDARMDASAENFQLGQNAHDALAGQGDIFSEPASAAALNIMANSLNGHGTQANAAIDSEADTAITSYLNDSRKHAKREAAKAKTKARDARNKGNEEIAQRYEAAAETYTQVDWAAFDLAVKANPDTFLSSDVDPVLIYANLPSAGLRAEVGDMFTPGQIATTTSGRQTTPFPQFNARGGLKAVDRWLVDNARLEAEARHDDFNATVFEIALDDDNIQQADKDLAELYLFGDEQPAVVPSILKPLLSAQRPSTPTETQAFKRWFGDSKVIDADGKPLVVYHGSNEDFNEFDAKRIGTNATAEGYGFYFTSDKDTASGYMNRSEGALFEVYLSIQNPLDINQAGFTKSQLEKIIAAVAQSELDSNPDEITDLRDTFVSNFADTYGMPFSKAVSEAAGMVLGSDTAIDQIAEIANVAGDKAATLKAVRSVTGHDGTFADGYGGNAKGGGQIFIAWFPEQIKSATSNSGAFDPKNADIRYSAQRKEQSVRLRAIHNLSQENLRFADEMGGLAVPSLAVVTASKGGVDGFGDVTLIATKSMADPRQEPVFTSDAYTATFPKPVWSAVPYPRVQKLYEGLKAMDKEFDGTISHYVWDHTREHPDAGELINRMEYSTTAQAMFLREQGKNVKPKMTKQAIPFEMSLAEFKKALPVLRAARQERLDNGPRKNGDNYQKAVAEVLTPYLDKLRSQVAGSSPVLVQDLIDDETQAFERNIGSAVEGFDRTGFKPAVDRSATGDAIRKQIDRQKAEFSAWANAKVMGMFDAPRLQLGSKKVEYTLPNIVEAMTRSRDARGQEKTMTYGEGQVRAAASTKLRNIEQMRELAKDSISDPAEYAQAKEQTQKLMDAWRGAVTEYTTITNWRGEPDFWEANDAAMKALAKWAVGDRTAARLRTLLSKDFKVSAIPADVFTQGVEAGNALLNAPVPYFEAKPQRAVALNEFAGAAVPKKASQQTRDILAKAGIPVVEYDSNKPESRRAAVDKLSKRLAGERDDVLFSRQRRAIDPEPQAEAVDDSASKALMLAPKRLGAMTGKAWDAWLNTQARKQGMDREHLQQIKGSSPAAEPVAAREMAKRTQQAEQELAQLQALVDENIIQITQDLRQQGVLSQTCD